MENKELWELYPHIWPTKSSFFTWLRGNLRRAVWEKYPVKLEFKNEFCKPPPEGMETRAKSGEYCALSGVWVGKSKAEIDHIEGNVSLKEWEDLTPFVKHLCARKDQLQYVEKEAHKVKSYAERMGIDFEEATKRKKIIAFGKLSVDEQEIILYNEGVEVVAKTKAARVKQYTECLNKETLK